MFAPITRDDFEAMVWRVIVERPETSASNTVSCGEAVIAGLWPTIEHLLACRVELGEKSWPCFHCRYQYDRDNRRHEKGCTIAALEAQSEALALERRGP